MRLWLITFFGFLLQTSVKVVYADLWSNSFYILYIFLLFDRNLFIFFFLKNIVFNMWSYCLIQDLSQVSNFLEFFKSEILAFYEIKFSQNFKILSIHENNNVFILVYF